MLNPIFKIFISLTLLSTISTDAFSQMGQSKKLFGGVYTPKGQPLPNTHIVNINQHLGTTTNKDGEFVIHAAKNDTIKITSIGYQTTVYIIPILNDYTLNKTFTLAEDTVNLAEVVIYPYPSTLKALKREFIELEMEDDPPLIDLHLEMAGIIQGTPSTGITITGPIEMIYNKFSRHGKMQRKFERQTRQEQTRLLAAKIYNADLIKKITGLKDDDQVKEFMDFCKFEPQFIIYSTTYQLYTAINNCYEQFINKQE